MAVPKRKVSKSKQGKRKSIKKLKAPALVECSQCHRLKLPHHICPNCGYYGKRKVMEVTK